MIPLKVMLIEDCEYDALLLLDTLRQGGYLPDYILIDTSEAMEQALLQTDWDIILSDYAMPQFSGPAALELLQKSGLDIPFIIISGTVGEDTAVVSLKAGAQDFLVKGHLARLLPAVKRELREAKTRAAKHRIEQALRKSEHRFKQLFDSNMVGIVFGTPTGTLVEANDAFLHMLGMNQESFTKGLTWFDLSRDEAGLQNPALLIALHSQVICTPFEKQFYRRDGQVVDALVSMAILEEGGENWVACVLDITERKQMERELMLAKEEAEIAKELAEEANRRKSQFLGNMSHELRTPLNIILGYADMMGQGYSGPLTEKQKKYIHNILFSGKHLLDMVNEILDFTKVEAKQMSIHKEQVDLTSLLQDVEESLQPLAEEKEIQLYFNLPPELSCIEADPVRLRQILFNLLNNAIKFNRPGGQVDLTISYTDNQEALVCEIRDTGIGIPADKIPELFNRFYQVDNSLARKYEGAGLGLCLTRQLIELHGGSISVESQENEGSIFTFHLPITVLACSTEETDLTLLK